MTTCTAHSKQTGLPCKQRAAVGRSVCRYHGGLTPVGRALPQYRDGRYSKHLPAELRERYEAARADPDLLAMREEVALIDGRLAELLARASAGESGARWGKALAAYEAYEHTLGTKGEAQALARLGEIIRAGAVDGPLWAEIGTSIELRRRLVESERKRLVELSQMITAEQLLVLMDRVVDTVRRNVTDRAALVAISNELHALANLPDRSQG